MIFRIFNIFEYKSPKDYLSIADFNKAKAYVYLYCAINNVMITDISLSFVVTRHPRELFRHLKDDCHFTITEKNPGIFVIEGDLIPIQIIETKRLSETDSIWLKNLNSELDAQGLNKLLDMSLSVKKAENIRAYLNTILKANASIMEEIKMNETKKFYATLEKIGVAAEFEARGETRGIKRGREEGRESGREEGIRLMASNLKKTGMSFAQIAELSNLSIDEIKRL
jgi:hypothetical protein